MNFNLYGFWCIFGPKMPTQDLSGCLISLLRLIMFLISYLPENFSLKKFLKSSQASGILSLNFLIRRALKKNLRNLGLPYVPCTLTWTKKIGQVLLSRPYLPKKFKHFGINVCSISIFPHFVRNSIKHEAIPNLN